MNASRNYTAYCQLFDQNPFPVGFRSVRYNLIICIFQSLTQSYNITNSNHSNWFLNIFFLKKWRFLPPFFEKYWWVIQKVKSFFHVHDLLIDYIFVNKHRSVLFLSRLFSTLYDIDFMIISTSFWNVPAYLLWFNNDRISPMNFVANITTIAKQMIK